MRADEYIAWVLLFLAISSPLGFRAVQSLVVWYHWMNSTMTLLSPDYIWFWLVVAIAVTLVIAVPLWWMAISLSKTVKVLLVISNRIDRLSTEIKAYKVSQARVR